MIRTLVHLVHRRRVLDRVGDGSHTGLESVSNRGARFQTAAQLSEVHTVLVSR
jgi:hypothetical protein